jgi:hypothetical protein
MRYAMVSLVVAVFLPFAVWAQQMMYAIPLQNDVMAYQNEIRKLYEKPVFIVGSDSRLVIKETGKTAVRVQGLDGRTGWVEKALVKIIRDNKKYSYDSIEIEARLDDPFMPLIFGGNEYWGKPIALDRSFAEALRENVDRETIQRQAN